MVDETLNTNYWGEIANVNHMSPSKWNKDVLNNMGETVIINSVKPVLYKNYFFNRESKPIHSKKETEIIRVDDVIKRTVKLVKYKNDIKEIVEKGKLQRDMFNVDKQLRLLPQPKDTTIIKKDDTIQFYKHECSDFVNGVFTDQPTNITNESALTVLRSSVATILAFVGCTETTIVPLQILTEATENYVRKMTKLLRLNVEKEKLEGESGFCDAVDRTCHEMGIGSVRNLVRYYQDSVLAFKTKRVNECKEELHVYEDSIEKLRDGKRQPSESSSADVDDENLVIPELHVTSISGHEMLSEPFEAGLQMLKTIERQQMRTVGSSDNASVDCHTMSMGLTYVKNELDDIKPFKRKRK